MDLNLYAVSTPAILAVIACELAYCLRQGNGYYQFEDSVANMATAFANQAAHAPHHSSEELNYTVGARASLTQRAAAAPPIILASAALSALALEAIQ
jgi:hypothetical protein